MLQVLVSPAVGNPIPGPNELVECHEACNVLGGFGSLWHTGHAVDHNVESEENDDCNEIHPHVHIDKHEALVVFFFESN